MKNNHSIPSLSFAILAAAFVLPCTVLAVGNPPITWSPAAGSNIVTDTDVLTQGTTFAAFNFGTTGVAGTTVNGVFFAPFEVPADDGPGTPTVGNIALTFTNELASNTAFSSPSAPFSNLSAPYQTLLSAGISDNNGTFTLTISGLSNGQQYLFQWWANSSASNFVNFNGTATATSTNALTLQDNVAQTEGGTGQFGVGTFTANGTGQEVVTFSSGFRPVLNAVQVRATPEPASAALLLGSGAMLLLRRRRAAAR